MAIDSIVADLICEAERLQASLSQVPEEVTEEETIQGVSYALQGSDAQTQARLLTELCDYLPHPLQEEALRKALTAVKAVNGEYDCIQELKRLAPRLSSNLLAEALELGKAMRTGMNRVRAIQILAPQMPPELLSEALDIAQAFRPNRYSDGYYCRALALSALANWLPDQAKPEILADALTSARAIKPAWSGDNVYCADALGTVADVATEPLRSELLEEALAAARAVEEHWRRAVSLMKLAPKLSEALREEALQEAIDAIVKEPESWAKSHPLCFPILASKLCLDSPSEVLKVATGIEDEVRRIKAIATVATELPEAVPEAMPAIKNTKFDDVQAQALAMLAPQLPPERLLEAVEIASRLPKERDRITTLIALADPISKRPKRELFSLLPAMLQSLSSSLSQRDFLRNVLALSAVIYVLGERKTVADIITTFQEIGEWWPQDGS